MARTTLQVPGPPQVVVGPLGPVSDPGGEKGPLGCQSGPGGGSQQGADSGAAAGAGHLGVPPPARLPRQQSALHRPHVHPRCSRKYTDIRVRRQQMKGA